jgi:tryptophanyl-tRNA synthetase
MQERKKRILTGDRPTGPLHLGHYVGTLENRVKLQDQYECFFIIADYQFLTDHLLRIKELENNIKEIVLDYLAVGINPEKSNIFLESRIPEIAKLTIYFSMLVTLARLQRNPTLKEEIRSAGFERAKVSYGFLGYPIIQAADILALKGEFVPVGKDQLPYIEQAREIARTFNKIFQKEVFPIPQAILSETPKLPGIDGKKMSKSLNNAIYLKDSKEEIERKIMKAFTDPKRIHPTDPGHFRGNVVFTYLEVFLKNKEELEELKKLYKRGKIGDVAVKKRLIDVLIKFLEPIQERRREFEKKQNLIKEILEKGIENTKKEAQKTLEEVEKTMSFNYLNLFS